MSEQEETVGEDYVPGTVIPAVVDGGQWAACFGLSWAEMMLYDQAGPRRIMRPGGQYLRRQAGTMGLASARSEVAGYFLDSDAEWLFMVDSDMGFAPDTVERLLSSARNNGVKVIGALCFAQKLDPDLAMGPFNAARYRIQPTLYRWVEVKDSGECGFQSITKYARDAYQSVAGTGAACLLVHRDVFAVVGPEPFMPITDPKAGGHGTARTFSEDLSFCIRANSASFTVGVDTSVKTTHYKGGIYLDEISYAMQQETQIQAKGHEIARRAEMAFRYGGPVGPLGIVKGGAA